MLYRTDVPTPTTLPNHFTRKTKQNNEFMIMDRSTLCLSTLFLVICFLVTGTANAQSPEWLWAKAMGGAEGEGGESVTLDASGNIYTTGSFEGTADFDPGSGTYDLTSAGEVDIFIAKLDGSGNFEWAISMGGASNDRGNSIALDASGNVYTTGLFEGTVDFDPGSGVFNLTSIGGYEIFISKLSSSGNFLWAKSIGGTSTDEGNSIALDASGNVYTTGQFFNTVDFDPGAGVFDLTSAGSADIFISKLNNSGNFIWAKAMGGTSVDRGTSIAIDASANVYTTGYFEETADFDPGAGVFDLTSAGSADIFISKLDNTGNFLWAKAMGGAESDRSYSIAIDASTNVYTTGEFQGTADFNPGSGESNLTSNGNRDIFISKLDNVGNFVWAKKMGGADWDRGQSIALDDSGNVYTTGFFRTTVDFDPGPGTSTLTSAGEQDIFISKLDDSGNFDFALKAGGTVTDISFSIAVDASGNSYLAGWFTSPSISFGSISLTNAGSSDIFIAKVGIGSGNPLSVSITSSTNVVCNGQNTGIATASATGGTPPYTYDWSNGGSGPTINNLVAGTYTVTVTDNNFATATASVSITQPSLLVFSPPLITQVSCHSGDNGSIQADATGGVAPYVFNWSNGSTGPTISNLVAGIYAVTVTDNNDCTGTATYMVTEPEDLIISLVELNNETCEGEQDGFILIAVSGGVNPIMAEWSNGFTGLVLVDLEPDIYTVTVTDNNDCVESASYTIDPGGTVDVTVLQIQDVSCHGGSNGTISVSASGGNEPYTYIWSNGMMGPSIIGLSPGSYLVTVTDANACTAVMSAAVSEPPLLTIAIAATDETSVGANDGTAAATAGGGIPSYNYLWSNDSTTATIAGLAPGTYTVTITDMNGCSVSGSGQVFAFGCTLDVMLSMDLSICEGDTIVIVPIVTGPSGGVSYLWTDGSTSDSIQVSQGGEYCVTLTDAAGCQDVDCIFVTVNIIPLLTCPVTNESVPDANDGAIQCDSLPGIVTYSWSNGATTSSITSLSPGEYCVTVTDVNGCTTSQCFNVQPANCQMTVTATQTDVSCNGDSTGSISLTVTGATEPVTYTWSNGGTSAAISNLSAGSYSVMVADSVGCFDNQSFLITEPPAIHIMVDSIAPVQDFDSGLIWITASGGIPPFSYQWIDPNGESFNSEDLNNLFSVGYYTVTVTDAAGCMVVVDSIFVDMDLAVDLQSHFKALKVYPVPTDDVLYIDIEIGITEVIISGADGRVYKHIINSGSNKIDVSDLGSGWYVIKISDGWQWYMGRMIKM